MGHRIHIERPAINITWPRWIRIKIQIYDFLSDPEQGIRGPLRIRFILATRNRIAKKSAKIIENPHKNKPKTNEYTI